MLTRTLAIEWGPEGIRVNSIIPGAIAGTEGMARLAPTLEAESEIVDCLPLRRLGTPDDMADVLRPDSRIPRSTSRPIRPKPLIATLATIPVSSSRQHARASMHPESG